MSTELAGDFSGHRGPGAGSPHPGSQRLLAFALPVSTSFRFALLIAAVAASSFFTYESIYLATPRGPALISLVDRCRAQALAQHPSGAIALASALSLLPCATGEGNVSRRGGPCLASVCSSSWP